MNKLGVCLSHGRRDILLKLLGGHFADKVVQKVKGGSVFRGTGDNWDLKVLKGHLRKDVQNEDLHLFASNLIENRVNFSHLPNVHPKGDIVNFPRHHFSLNGDEWKVYINCAKILIGRIIVEFFPKFKWLKSVIPENTLSLQLLLSLEWQVWRMFPPTTSSLQTLPIKQRKTRKDILTVSSKNSLMSIFCKKMSLQMERRIMSQIMPCVTSSLPSLFCN